ncbi:MAG TPA: branched-chain amino acid ABC transporter substrate-binding protein [Acidiferrobacterales bacterium]|nr:branched-chain amino acid ABC transporter substrate-binding protein [Acidiferrobacterales bacterium]
MYSRSLNRTLMAVMATVVVATACSKKDETPKTAGSEMIVKIGQVSPLTGPQAHLGKDNDNGARLAIDEANARGVTLGGQKVKFVLLSEDDQADPKTATIVAQKLVDAQVKGVIGHLNSGASIPASKIYHDAGIPQISPSATAIKYTDQGFKTAFRTMTNDRQQGKVLGEFLVKKMGGTRVAIIDDRTAYGQGLADEVEKAVKASGGELVAREYTSDKATDFSAILTSIKGKNPDVLFFGGMDPQGAPMVKQMRSLGLKAKFLGGDGLQTTEFLKLASTAAEGVTASSPGLPIDSMPGGKAFRDKFTAKYGPIQTYAPYAYDAATAMITAMEKAGSAEPAKVLAELPNIRFAGVTGEIGFDAKGDVLGGAITLYRVKAGKWEVVETVMSGAAPNK